MRSWSPPLPVTGTSTPRPATATRPAWARASGAAGIPREEFFVTTKLDGEFQGEDRAIAGIAAALQRMEFDYVDLLLIHWPKPWEDQFVSTWRTFESIKAEGLARSIGVSNFKPAHLERLAAETGTVPAVNQIQLNPAVVRLEQREYDTAHGIVTESWSPFGGGGSACCATRCSVRSVTSTASRGSR